MSNPRVPKVVVKSLWQFVQENKNTKAISGWFQKNQGLDAKTADFVAGKIAVAKSVEELDGFLNGSDDEPVKMSAQEMQMMAGGRTAVVSGATKASADSKWPWE